MLTVYLIFFLLYAAGIAAARQVAGPELRRDVSWTLLAVLIALVAATIVRPNPLILDVLYAAAVVVGVRTRLDAACRFVLLSVLTIPLSSPLGIGSLYLLILTSQNALTLGLLVALLVLPERRPVEIRPLLHGAILVWLIFAITSFGYDRAYNVTNMFRNIMTGVLEYVLPFYLLRNSINQRRDIGRLFACFIGAAVTLLPFALFEAKMGWAPVDAILSLMGGTSSRSSVIRGGLLRASTTFSVTLAFALFMCLALLAAVAFRDRLRSPFYWRLTIAGILVGILLAQSRGAWITLAASAAAFYALRGKFGRLFAVAGAAGIAFAMLLAASSMSPQIAAFLGIDQSTGGQISDYRQLLLTRGLEEGMKAPLLGQDIGVVQQKLGDIRQGQGMVDFVNTYLNFFLGSGLIGLAPFVITQLSLLVALALQARRRDAPPDLQRAQYFLGASFGGMMVFLFTCSFFDRVPIMFIMLVAAAQTTATLRQPAGQQRSSPRREPALRPEPA